MPRSRVTETVEQVLNIMYEDLEDKDDSLVAFIMHVERKGEDRRTYSTQRLRKNATQENMITYGEIIADTVNAIIDPVWPQGNAGS